MTPLLEIAGLRIAFATRAGDVRVLDGLDLEVGAGEVVGLVGETGSGKSVSALAVMGLLTTPGRVTGGTITFDGEDLVALDERVLRERYRGRRIAMIFQNARSALNPVMAVGDQLGQALGRRGLRGGAADREAAQLLERVGIADPVRRLRAYPHELSGGMAQRVMIALALSLGPELLIADEPTTALDVTVQDQIAELLLELREETGMAILMITHDLALAAETCDRIAVLYAGRLAEAGPTRALIERPAHPYTAGLLASRPYRGIEGRIPSIPGRVAALADPPSGCRFHPRCPSASAVCSEHVPATRQSAGDRRFACHHAAVESEASHV